MLKRTFNPEKPMRAVAYLRMSTDTQNPRSPDQQLAEIHSTIGACRYPWEIVKAYRDDGKSGRLIRTRTGFQEMCRDIRSGVLHVDLILVDTFERLGRNDELQSFRKEMYEQHGVLILTADSRFADPTTSQGKIYSAFEALRATEENRVKAHQVSRGKCDAARQGLWPGGKPPFGHRLVPKVVEINGHERIVGNVLEPHPQESPVVQKLFTRALETGHGGSRLTQFLNGDPEIPEKFKPFQEPTVRSWLEREIYYGELVYGKDATDIVGDVRVKEANPQEEWIRVPDFCPPLVSRDDWDEVAMMREVRRRKKPGAEELGNGKQIKPLVPGLSLNYLLSGLVRCGECNAAMQAATSGRKNKEGKSYGYYACPRARTGSGCTNKRYVPEEWLRSKVIDVIVSRLLSSDE